jgi:uncharacterized protein
MRFFFETKSWRLFSFLFGLGFSLQLLRADERGARFIPVYIRRLAILFVFGIANALFYEGDILMFYAQLGLVLLLFRGFPARSLLLIAALLLLVFPLSRAATSLNQETTKPPTSSAVSQAEAATEMEERRQTHPHAVGSVRGVMAYNAAEAIPPHPFRRLGGAESSLPFFAMFLLGLYAGKQRLFHDFARHEKLIRGVLRWGLTIGLLSMAGERILNVTTGYTVFREQGAGILAQFAGDLLFAYGSTALALGYAAVITVLAQGEPWRKRLSPLGAVGRVALTVYLTQTLLFGALFYGFAFGQVFRLGPAAVTAWAIVFFSAQIAVSTWWIRHFRYGPAEWLWRSLTYMRAQPFRLRRQSAE